jgi:hypothetical protein
MWQPVGISGAVRYDVAQTLTTAQQAQARANENSVSKSGDTITGNFTINGTATINGGTSINGDLTIARVGGSGPTTGAIFFGNTATKYLYYDGTNFDFSGGAVYGGQGRLWGAGDMTPVNKAGDTMTGNLQSNGAGSTINQGPGATSFWCMGSGGSNEAFMSFHRPGVFACNFGLGTDGNFHMGGWSFGAGTSYQFWTTRDFASLPSLSGAVTNGRLVYAGDYTYALGGGLVEPYGGSVVSGGAGQDRVGNIILRHRYMQLFTTGWFTIGYA